MSQIAAVEIRLLHFDHSIKLCLARPNPIAVVGVRLYAPSVPRRRPGPAVLGYLACRDTRTGARSDLPDSRIAFELARGAPLSPNQLAGIPGYSSLRHQEQRGRAAGPQIR